MAVNFLVLLCLLCTSFLETLVAGQSSSEIAAYFATSLSPQSEVFLPGNADYSNDTTQRWDAYKQPSYIISVKPALNTDVQKIIIYATLHNIPFLGTGGGHGYSTTLGSLKNGIEIDLGLFSSVSVDVNSNLMTIGGSVTIGDVLGPLSSVGKEIPTGTCKCVGMLGATLGGGIGLQYGLHGPMLDSLVSLTMVTGTGEVLNASTHENSDLFWGMRGAGFNYGIVTSATYSIYDATNNGLAMRATLTYSAATNGTVWQLLKNFAGKMPDALSIIASTLYLPSAGQLVIILEATYFGPTATGVNLIQPFLNASPISQNITVLPWMDLGEGPSSCINGLLHSNWGLNLYAIDVPTLTQVFNNLSVFIGDYSDLESSIFVVSMFPSSKALSVPDADTAYPYRNTVAYLFLSFEFTNTSLETDINQFSVKQRNSLVNTGGGVGIQVYVNYAHGDEGAAAWYAPRKLPKLRELKRIWDPISKFSFYNGI